MRLVLPLLFCAASLAGCRPDALQAQHDPYDSGGPLMPEQAAYDVVFYDLALRIEPAERRLDGTLTATARVVHPLAQFVLDLDPRLDVTATRRADDEAPLPFERHGGKLWIDLPRTHQPGETVSVSVDYGGVPREAPNPPWDGGLTWAETKDGHPWIATSCQTIGADVWWPVKDHVSDEPDSMALHLTVPRPLVAASNGRLQRVEENDDGTRTYHWFVSTPINVYTVALNIAPYQTIETQYESVAGEGFPVVFYVLPEDAARGQKLFSEILDHLTFFEETLGPYPFRADKYGVAQTPHLGMEHQTIIAYGADFDNGAMTGGIDWGFDALHHHELAHEWWGNLVTNTDWRDMWLHEGFGSYMQPLYLEWRGEPDAAAAMRAAQRAGIANRQPLAPRTSRSSQQIYGGDIYIKGASVLHTLRYLLGDASFFEALRRMAYPDSLLARQAAGCPACRFATTNDFLTIAEEVSGQQLDWFFDVYVRQPKLPELVVRRDETTAFEWKTPDGLPFPMPIDIEINGERRRLAMPDGRATLSIPRDAEIVLDPDAWVLRRE